MTIAYDMIDDRSNFGNRPGDGPLAPGGKSFAQLPQAKDVDRPSTMSAAAQAQKEPLQFVRDLSGGNRVVRQRGSIYLPQADGESRQNYQNRLKRSLFLGIFGETVKGLTGFVFAKDPALGDDVPPAIAAHLENIDNDGTHFDVFARELLQDALTAGHSGILVEFPQTDGMQTAAAELTGAVRPYWVPIFKENIMSWRREMIGGRHTLTQLVLKECTTVPDGLFGEKDQTRYRVFYRSEDGVIGYQLLELTQSNAVIEVDAGTYPTQSEIPFAEIVTSGRKSFLVSDPPLLDLAYANIAHYQSWSDRATSVHLTCVPIWVETGVTAPAEGQQPAIVLGPHNARQFTDPNAKAGYESHDGAALDSCTKIIEELKSDMAVLGLSMLAADKRAAETAEAKRLDKGATDSQLGVTARGLQDGIERALYFHARYLKLPDGGSVTINRDFDSTVMDAQTMTAYANLAATLRIPLRVVLEMLQRGGRIPEDEDLTALEAEINARRDAVPAKAAA